MVLAEAQRDSSDPRTIGGLFILFCDEARDTAFQEVLSGLMRYLEDFLRKQLPYNNTYLDEIIGRFFDGLPDGLRYNRFLHLLLAYVLLYAKKSSNVNRCMTIVHQKRIKSTCN